MKQSKLVTWVQVIIFAAALMLLVFLAAILPAIATDILRGAPELQYMYWPGLSFVWATAIPFYGALWSVWRLLDEIDGGNAFCSRNVSRLGLISRLALTECILYFAAMAGLLAINLLHPGIFLLMTVIILIGFFIAAVAAVLSLLAQRAGEIQAENNLTI